ncbi:helix-turn-helix domain-containing protein [Thiomicrospira sp. XS5]|uniref:helix-turn-helix domain-containing protein n=1 Tax=Thiomicrospira sp. XS5 TaxID=1775636 RepID=UPI00136632BA|nr:helix-turn-helix transcriptional regulator [Thiomicrospira sp. XS5]
MQTIGHYSGLKNIARDFALRLKELIAFQSVRSFARSCQLSETALRKYLNGESTPNLERLIAIANQSGVTVEWLATGKGEKYPPQNVAEPEGSHKTSPQLHEIERIVLNKLIANTEKRLSNIQELASHSQSPAIWEASIEMEQNTLSDLKAELGRL